MRSGSALSFVVVAGGVFAAWACGSDSAVTPRPGGSGGGSAAGGLAGSSSPGGSSAGGGSPGGAAGTTSAGAGPGGNAGSGPGGNGAGGETDASYPDVVFSYDSGNGAGGLTQDGSCAETTVQGTLEFAPADIIIAVDNSGSMGSEAGFVQSNMNAFSTQISGTGIDAHVVLISSYPGNGNGICIDPPLGAGGCPAIDTKLPTFLHVNQNVASRNALELIVNTYPQWSSVLRGNAQKHIVVVTDDDSDWAASTFDTQLKALSAQFNGYQFHAIYAFHAVFSFTSCGPIPPLAANEGTVYRQLVAMTGGVEGNLCDQNFGPVFNAVATSVVNNSPLDCDIPMPTTDAGIINPADVKIEITLPPAGPQLLGNVGSAGGCGSQGFYYDNPASPSVIHLCPETCNAANSVSNPSVKVLLGCLGA